MIFRDLVPTPNPETVSPIVVTAGFSFIYLNTGTLKETITIHPEQLPRLIRALQTAEATRLKAKRS